jgi:hypothetical protein
MSDLIDRLCTHPVLDWIAQATLFVFVIGVIIAMLAAFCWGVA